MADGLKVNSHGNIILAKSLTPRQYFESTTPEGAPVSEGLPQETNGNGDPRQTTETATHSPLATVYA